MNIVINSMQDVAEFINGIYKLGVNFHPDSNFADYINPDTHDQAFTDDACQVYDTALMKCIEVCEWSGVDIYEMCLLFDGDSYEHVLVHCLDDEYILAFKDSKPFADSEDFEDMYTACHTLKTI
jgi:hypothetical protein